MLFAIFCRDLDKVHVKLILHTEVRWLSKGNCLRRFPELYDEVLEFFRDSKHADFLKSAENKSLVCYLADIFFKLNLLNKDLQGGNTTLISARTKILGFIAKLPLYRDQLLQNIFYNFPLLKQCSPISQVTTTIMCDHINMLVEEFQQRFADLSNMEFPQWLSQPFSASLFDVDVSLQDELAEMQNDAEASNIFKHIGLNMWFHQTLQHRYPTCCSKATRRLLPFPTSYLVESGFSVVNDLLTKKRNKLDVTKRGDLRLRLTHLKPDIKALVACRQAHGSH